MTTWYAQASAAWASANWNDDPAGAGNPGSPVDGDTTEANGYAVAIGQCLPIGITLQCTAGGSFALTSLDISAYVAKASVVAPDYVLYGHDNYTGGSAGLIVGVVVDESGVIHTAGLCAGGVYHSDGIVDNGTYHQFGIVASDGYHVQGILVFGGSFYDAYYAYGVVAPGTGPTERHADGILWHAGGGDDRYFQDGVFAAATGRYTLDYAIEAGGGTYHEAANTQVKGGVKFGPNSTYEGVYGSGYTYGDSDASKVLTTADGAGTYQPVAASAVQKGVAVGVSPAVGTLVGIVDSSGNLHSYGTCDSTQGWTPSGIVYNSGGVVATGTLDSNSEYHAIGVIYGSGSYATEASRNSTTAAAGDIVMGKSVTIAGSTTNGTLDLSLYCLISTVVSAAYVATGHDNRTGGDHGSYPTTATSQAAQLATDQAAVTLCAGYWLPTQTVLGVVGTRAASASGTTIIFAM